MRNSRNLTMLMDFYQLTMANGYLKSNMQDTIAYFDMYFRRVPDDGGFLIVAGLEQLIDYFENLKFTKDDIEFLKEKNIFSEEFLEYLKDFKFSCDVWAMEEGTAAFPAEPIITVKGPIIQCQMIETMVLLTINHQSLIATKTNRIVRAAKGRTVMEFGSRRAQGYDGAILGARASYIGGCVGTACTLAEKMYGVPALGTMGHSWIQSFESEYEAFTAYAKEYPKQATLLVDTYDVLNSGVPNAIKTHKEVLEPMGEKLKGIRIDSGDIAYLSKRAREMLDEAGLEECIIVASSSLDEHLIKDIINQGAKVDSFGVGENLITSKSSPVLGGVYKLVAIEKNGEIIPKIKISENIEKVTIAGYKRPIRFYDRETDKAIGDVLVINDEIIDENEDYEIFHPVQVWRKIIMKNYYTKELQKQIYKKGKLIYESPKIEDIKKRTERELATLKVELMRFEFPQKYYVDYSEKLWNLQMKLLKSDSWKN